MKPLDLKNCKLADITSGKKKKKKHPNIIQLIKSNVLLDMQHETASWG